MEKRVISNFFCSGAYGFEDAQEYLRNFNTLSHLKNLYISHIIYQMLLEDKAFSAAVCTDYSDWGTLKDWNRYKAQFGTLFVDLDGTLVRNSGEHFEPVWGTTEGLKENIQVINRLYDSGKVQIIITTSRKEEARLSLIHIFEELAGECPFKMLKRQQIFVHGHTRLIAGRENYFRPFENRVGNRLQVAEDVYKRQRQKRDIYWLSSKQRSWASRRPDQYRGGS